jgi:hypothetical protein
MNLAFKTREISYLHKKSHASLRMSTITHAPAESRLRNWITLPFVAASKINCSDVYDCCKIHCLLMHMNTTAEHPIAELRCLKSISYCRNYFLHCRKELEKFYLKTIKRKWNEMQTSLVRCAGNIYLFGENENDIWENNFKYFDTYIAKRKRRFNQWTYK